MLQRIFHVIRTGYPLAVFWMYLAAFGVALLCMFLFPPISLGLVLLGVLALVPAVLLNGLLRLVDRAATRPYLKRGVCPSCRQARAVALGPGEITCVACGCRFATDGDQLPTIDEPSL